VGGKPGGITTKAMQETIEFLIDIDFSKEGWQQIVLDLNTRFSNYESLEIFKNADLKAEFLSYAAVGFNDLARAEKLGNDIIMFKNEANPHTPLACTKTLIELKLSEMTRLRVNLDYRFSAIQSTWTAEFVKDNIEAQEILLSWVAVFNDGCSTLNDITQAIALTLENLLNNDFPAEFGGFSKSCQIRDPAYEGDLYEILKCYGHTAGYSCDVVVTHPRGVTPVQQLHPVVYNGVQIQGHTAHQEFFKNMDTQAIMVAECTHTGLIHPLCEIFTIPVMCKHSIEEGKISEIITWCNFTRVTDHLPYVLLDKGGVLVQPGIASAQASAQVLTDTPPYIIYSSGLITLTYHQQELSIMPEQLYAANIIVNSALSTDQIQQLENKVYWAEVKESIDYEDYIDYAIICWELITIPCILLGLIKTCKTRPRNPIKQEKADRRSIYKKNVALLRK